MGASKKLAAATADKRELHAELTATAVSIGRTIPQFIDDNEQLEILIDYIKTFRTEIALDGARQESLIVIDGFLGALREVL